jgi:hypothetical protein
MPSMTLLSVLLPSAMLPSITLTQQVIAADSQLAKVISATQEFDKLMKLLPVEVGGGCLLCMAACAWLRSFGDHGRAH